MTKKTVKILTFLLGLLLAVYLAYQFYMVAYPSYKTEVAMVVTISDSINVDGIVVRNETVIENNASGIINFLVGDGDKVAIGAPVAQIFTSTGAAEAELQKTTLENQLNALKKASELNRTSGTNIDFVYSKISNLLTDFTGSIACKSFSSIASDKTKLIEYLNSFAISSGKTPDVLVQISELESQISQVSTGDISASSTLYSPIAGYFISTVDGYEQALNYDSIYNFNTIELRELISEAEGFQLDETHCKVVSDYTWLYAATVPQGMISNFSEGAKYYIDFNYAMVKNVPVIAQKVNFVEGEEYGTVIFECTYLNPSLAALRSEKATINFTNYEGIRIPRTALRLYEGQTGVYVKYGSTVKFKCVNIIFENEEYILSEVDASDENALKMYDEIIAEGKEIYVGKDLGN